VIFASAFDATFREVKMSQTHNFITTFRERGFVILTAFLGSSEQFELRRACDTVLERARAQCRETAHTTPRISLFRDGSPLVSDLEMLSPVIAFASSSRVCRLLPPLALAQENATPQVKEAHYYHEQTKRNWDGDWHRDSQFGRTDPELERQLFESTTALHLRVVFEDDDRLEIVPGSHRRWDSAEELSIRRGGNRATDKMPHAERVVLRRGDACIFHAWSIHRATYRCAPIRRTLDLLYGFGKAASGL
jgi:hypothetical protein